MSALEGIRVLELAEGVSGEYCGKLLADFGAEVIKLEAPGGSPTRGFAPLLNKGTGGVEQSGLFAYLNTNKHSVVVDLAGEAGRTTLAKLLTQVDVLIDDHPAGWLAELGLVASELETRYPKLVACSITAYGLDVPEERRHAEDINVFHASGWGYHTPSGETVKPPLKGGGRFIPSYEAGLEASMCISAALYERAESHLGQFIEVSKQDVLGSRIDYVLGQMVAGDMDVSLERTAFDLGGPAGIFACRDGYAYIWMSAPAHWEALATLLGEPAWMKGFPDRWMELECTPERVAECRKHLAEWLRNENKHEVSAKAQALGLTLVAVNNAGDLIDSPQYQYRGFFSEVSHSVLGTVQYPTVPYKLSETSVQIHRAAPLLGQHSSDYLAETVGEQTS